ncbi:hypothetical protein PK98_07245 [Croceibacterium mercuriale]|uniref:Uncharacterized protein n=1 Tax=Croceibacterium mercuriale TaxID=1572751 RepID=A0A0B2C1Z4_9SPHN|nr:hypothetical protein [Croceibacterium mercuriale]KHL26262.1 hypothetical protein PK98_07245 [Croceibacterium mercuriale]
MQDPDSFINRTDWFTATAALTIWFAHFMLVWCASVIWPGQALGRIVGVLLTVIAFAGLGVLWRRVRPVRVQSVAGLGLALASMAIAFSCVPALIG